MKQKITFDYKKFANWFNKRPIIVLLLIPILLSIFFRIQPMYLPITDDWAMDTFDNNLRMSINSQIEQQYSQLPQQQKDQLINNEINKVYQEHSEEIQVQIQSISNQFKSQLQDENDQTYLLAIDPWLWFGYSKNYIETGQFGTGYNKDGKDWFYNRNGRVGRQTGLPFNSVITIILYKIINIFKDYSVMATAFLVPLIITTLSIIPLFFIVRMLVGNVGAFFAACMYAIQPALLSRTVAGFSDTDCYTVFFPLLCIWLLFACLKAKEKWKQYSLISLCGINLVFFNIAWGSGSWVIMDIIIGGFIFYIIIKIFENLKLKIKLFNKKVIHNIFLFVTLILSFVFLKGIFAVLYLKDSFFVGFQNIFNAIFVQPFWLLGFKNVAASSIWPNVLTTVAELNTSSLGIVIKSMGGTLMFVISIIGIFLLLYKSLRENMLYKVFVITLNAWFIITLFGGTISLRFSALFVPAFSIMFGIGLGLGYKYFMYYSKSLQVNKIALKFVVFLLYGLLFLVPITQGYLTIKNEVPSYNDAWHETLLELKYDSEEAIISSWWDFGHWFVAISEQHVTSDGGDQGLRIYWMGDILTTNNETHALNILRMLNCGSENGYNFINEELNNEYGSKVLLDKIIRQNITEARITLKNNNIINITKILNNTHCNDILPQYFITSEDMVQKSGVWGHFGSWDFERAEVFNKAKKLNHENGVKYIEDFMNISHNDAIKMYYKIQQQSGDEFISSWPSYQSGIQKCKKEKDVLICNNLFINLTNYDTYIKTSQGNINIYSLVYKQNDTLIEKKFNNPEALYSVLLIDNNKIMFADSLLATSVFTKLFFYDGAGLDHFKKFTDITSFTGQRIITWRVNLEK